MPRSVLCRFLLGLVPAWLFTAALGTAAPDSKGETKSDKAPGSVEQIRKALDLTVSVDFASQPLPTVLAQLGEQHQVNIVLDRMVMQTMGVEPSELSIEYKAKNVKLRNALRNILSPHSLTFGVVGDALLVSTEETIIYRQLKHRISVDVDNVPMNKALKDLSATYGVNVVVDPRTLKTKVAEAPVSLQVDDVPFETAVRLMAEMAGLRPVRMGNVLFVTSEERAEKLKDSDSLVPAPGLPPAGPGVVVPGLPGILGPGGIVPAVPVQPVPGAPGAPAVPKDKDESSPPAKEEPKKDPAPPKTP